MKILYISHDSGLYGATRSLLNLIDGLKKQDVIPYVILPYPGDLERELKRRRIQYKVVLSNNNYRQIGEKKLIHEQLSEICNLKAIYEIVKLVRAWKIDLIHTNNLCMDVGAISSIICKKPHVWHMREFMEEDFNLEFHHPRKMRYLLNRADTLVAISNSVYEKYSKLYNRKKMCIVYNGVPAHEYVINRTEYLSNANLSLLFSGAISKGKGQMEAIQAVEYLINHGYSNIKLFLAGNGKKEYINKLKKYIKEAQITDFVSFLGFQKQLSNIRKNMDIALVCSKSEAFGRVTVESMLSELLVIGADVAGTKELIENSRTGLLYEKGNYKELAGKIKYALENKQESIKIIKNAKKYAVKNFLIENNVKQIYEIYSKS